MANSAYIELLKDPRWQKKRLEILQRDEFTCRECFSPDHTLHVHHTKYTVGPPWETPNECLITLCEDCHYYEEDFKKTDLYSFIDDCGLTRYNIKHLLLYVSFLVKKHSPDYHNSFWAFHNEVMKKLVPTTEELQELSEYQRTGKIGSAKIAQPDLEQSQIEKQSSSS